MSVHQGLSTPFSAVVLAAGLGSRLGGCPKCLLHLDGESILRRQVRALLALHCAPLMIVLGHYGDRVAAEVSDLPVAFARNPEPGPSPASSLHCGLRALPRVPNPVLVALADQPLLRPEDYSALLEAFAMRPPNTDFLIPTVDDLPGNPVVFSSAVRDALVEQQAGYGAKDWQQEHPERVYRWPTNNPRYRVDVDCPADLDRIERDWNAKLTWPAGV